MFVFLFSLCTSCLCVYFFLLEVFLLIDIKFITLICNITPGANVNEFYKHKGTKDTKLCLFFYFLCALRAFVFTFSRWG